ncbi:MAG: NAD(P)/FAD-dependent oxidoreductase [Patescibacteria group bacterium]
MMNKLSEKYDLVIVGSGPAGYTAGIYARRFKLKTLIVGKSPGGTIADAHKVCNFPTFGEIAGEELTRRMHDVAKDLGVKSVTARVEKIGRKDYGFLLETTSSGEVKGDAVLLATGTKRRKLNLEHEDYFLGRGVSYCATCDGPFFQDKIVAVVGGSNAATTAALYLSEIAKRVYLIYRKDELRGEEMWKDQVEENPKIEVVYNTNVVSLGGENKLERIGLDNEFAGKDFIRVDGLFVEIGSVPANALAKKIGLDLSEEGYLRVGEDQSTNLPGFYGAGDITTGSGGLKQVITACSEGAIAATNIYKFLKSKGP